MVRQRDCAQECHGSGGEGRLAQSTPVRRTESVAHGSRSVESVLEAIRRLWNSIEVESPPELQAQLKREIDETISRLKWRVEKCLRASRPTFKERFLFEPAAEPRTALTAAQEEPAKPRLPPQVIRIYDKDLVDLALTHVPEAIKFSDSQAFREHLIGKIRCNSLATRRRIAGYLLNRFFPGDVLHKDLLEFAAKKRANRLSPMHCFT